MWGRARCYGDRVSSIDGFWAVIPAGGAGTRLWPLSRAGSPKFLHDLTGSGRSLLQATVDRLEPLAAERVVVVTGARHEEAVRAQLAPSVAEQVLAEPSPRDSMAAIGWAAAVIEARDPEAVIGSFAADHVIGDEDAFRERVREAVEVARTGQVVTIGIEPTFPSTGFGYIHTGAPLEVEGAPNARAVQRFVEKPDEGTAREYLASGEFRWNAGMFVVKASVLLDVLGTYHPELTAGLRQLAAEPAALPQIWDGLLKIAIDHAVAEPAADDGRVAVILGDFPWDDVGDFASLAQLLAEPAGPVAEPAATVAEQPVLTLGSDNVLTEGASGLVASSTGRLVAVLGLEDVVVVDTDDVLLVTTREKAQQVKGLVDRLKAEGRADLV